jgi:8-oxo-dGTP diphosphatase
VSAQKKEQQRNPLPTTDAIIAGADGRIVLVLRKNEPRGWALPGGFVDSGEEIGAACRREAKEETGLDVELVSQLFTYSDPKRDPRKHTISTVYACKARPGAEPKGADDAEEARWFGESDLPWEELCFDHGQILRDYFQWVRTGKKRDL